MKRTVPLLITAVVGFVIIASFFVPATESWGEVASIWFDILAAIAFVLGGGNLLKVHLKKISDQQAGWGYSGITIVSFLVMLIVGIVKWGSPPSPNQEYYGQSFAPLAVADFPKTYEVPGTIPRKPGGGELPMSVRQQMGKPGDAITFRGWMLPSQKAALDGYQDTLQWRAAIEALNEEAQPEEDFRGKLFYYPDLKALAFAGHMTDAQRNVLLALSGEEAWQSAVRVLSEKSKRVSKVTVDPADVPPRFSTAAAGEFVQYDAETRTLSILGPMSIPQRDALAGQFPLAKPLSASARGALLDAIRARGPLNEEQVAIVDRVLDATWTVEQLRTTLDQAGAPEEVDKSAEEMLAEMKAGVDPIVPTRLAGEDTKLNDAQVAVLNTFAGNDWNLEQLIEQLGDAGDFAPRQARALQAFMATQPTAADRKKEIAFQLMKADGGSSARLTPEQQDFLFEDYQHQVAWRETVGRLFAAAHEVKFPWSGQYLADGNPFWWLYRYLFTPLTATMFALLAFYVASAAFRAFRAKNFEAILLLGTAFIILLGRTFAGVILTGWIPENSAFAGLRIDNLTVEIMRVVVTTGNRAIILGVALGVASTSLRVLLGIDRSYLGSSEE